MDRTWQRLVYITFALAFILRLYLFFKPHFIWWDSAVYIGMAKYIYTFGQAGLWEDVRPLVWPVILGFFWKANIDVITAGRVMELIFSMSVLYLVYRITKRLFSERAAFFALLALSFNSTFLFFTYKLYTEIPSAFFALFAFFMLLRGRYYSSGFFAAIAFLTKFPQGIIAGIIVYLVWVKQFRDMAKSIAGFSAPTVLFLIFNKWFYGSFFHTFEAARNIISNAGLWIFAKPWYYYLVLSLKENFFMFILVFFGIYFIIQDVATGYVSRAVGKLNKRAAGDTFRGAASKCAALWRRACLRFSLLIMLVISFSYFSILAHKESRFSIIFLPYFAIISGAGFDILLSRLQDLFAGLRNKRLNPAVIMYIAAALVFLISVFSFACTARFEHPEDWERAKDFFAYLKGREIKGNVFASHPAVNLFAKEKVNLLYYPVFNSTLAKHWLHNIPKNSYLFMDSCEGGMICPPSDLECEAYRRKIFNKGVLKYYKKHGRCEYFVRYYS